MTSIAVPCPQCKKKLKLRDKSLLGKKARCPNCKHAFVLQLPETAAVEKSGSRPVEPPPEETPAPPAPSSAEIEEVKIDLAQPASPVVGTSAKWVPDEPAEPVAATPPPQPQNQFPQIDTSTPAPASPDAPQIDTGASDGGFPNISTESSGNAGVARMRELRRKNAKRRNVTIISALALILLVGVGAYFAWPKVEQTMTAKPAAPVQPQNTTPSPAPVTPVVSHKQETAASPTSGEPIRLLYVPAGTRVLVHLHPAALWEPGSQGEEFRACLGPLGVWAGQKIKDICMLEPAQIKEVTFCLILGSPGAPPEYAAVVRPVDPIKRSALIAQFDGQRLDDYNFPVYSGGKNSYMIVDENTYVIGPPGMDRATEMAESREFDSSTSPGIESILKQTDRDRHLTVVFDPDEVRRQQDVLVPEKAHPFLNEFLDWIGDDVETVAWSMHLGRDDFYSEFTFRNTTMIRPPQLADNLKNKLDQLPHEMLEGVQKMNPGTVGTRKVIGRFPAMLKAFSMANHEKTGERYAQLISNLPERAAPNLAVASLLTWDESTRTDFSVKAKPKPTGPKLPDKVVDRLKMKIDVDFRRTPLQEAFAYIGEETKTNIEVDGEALKLVGYTKNMPQTMNLGMAPGLDAIEAIFNVKDQDQLCLVIDEAKKTATITSKPYAKNNNLTVFVFPPKN
ncbi:hypothetical protein Enr10x_56290 [Gimesia panareensis]|uniref:Zinc finger/thioredoxin putative domain-containing protein n=1 Tax=Gimesia panareensis TaxID=2527978 RepID=A0A517QF72_9PLAN|nr:hypothetical protein [Gimesia panareensis]QDT30264.1 hypothetical protein Enr10x_56290 [Gimesia panareensis]